MMSRHFERFVIHQVIVPARRVLIEAPEIKSGAYVDGLSWDQKPICVIEGYTNDGIVALGESNRLDDLKTVRDTLNWLLGKPLAALHPDHCWSHWYMPDGLPLRYPSRSNYQARIEGLSYGVLQSLWLDVCGKAASIPACQLLGGAVRSAVLTSTWANRPTAEVLAGLIEESREAGFSGIKLKSNPAGDTLFALAEIIDSLPAGFSITVDPMLCLPHPSVVAPALRKLADRGTPLILEDPFAYEHVHAWRYLRQYPNIRPICHTRNIQILNSVIEHDLAGDFNISSDNAFEILHMDRVVESRGGSSWCGSSLELGINQHVRLHTAAAARTCTLASDLSSEMVRDHTLITPRMAYKDSHAIVPLDRPGLGVELDTDALKKYTQQIERVG